VRGLAIVALVLAGAATARADAIWCGTFGDERLSRREASIPALPHALPPPPAIRVRVERVLVDGVRDGRAARRIDAALALDGCLPASELGRGAAWTLELLVGADGAVIDARATGEPRGMRCLIERARSIRLARGDRPRIVSARVAASAR